MNSSFNPVPNYYQFNIPYYMLPGNRYSDGYGYRSEGEGFNQPQADAKNGEEKGKEVYKDDFVTGFVPDHNHGTVDYTSIEDGHVHQCLDITFPPKLLKDGTHIHYVEGYVLFEDGHHHYYKAWSGPGIPVGNGMHVHYYDFYTTVNDGHRHRIKGVDMPAPGTL
ncbi:YmaF family protein [Fonticella tunisiensis]|uniref:YmaF-like protein n=1 Tax=Fonticella tunisiensis TaxID=1096341 RepID=A0A4R7KU38_9CLOT|nr:YmaF family protein [Fonticella tunisiensis]TDT62760.1 YmaF-like protein [Fonticella tunisiensis]